MFPAKIHEPASAAGIELPGVLLAAVTLPVLWQWQPILGPEGFAAALLDMQKLVPEIIQKLTSNCPKSSGIGFPLRCVADLHDPRWLEKLNSCY